MVVLIHMVTRVPEPFIWRAVEWQVLGTPTLKCKTELVALTLLGLAPFMGALVLLHHYPRVLCISWNISISESLPNITGDFSENYHDRSANMQASGCFKVKQTSVGAISAMGSSSTPNGWDFDASLSSSIYQDDAPVRPFSITTAFLMKY